MRREILSLGPDCPWALRRLKEDLKDLNGHRLFPDRHAHTITFRLNRDEFELYKAVTAYINEFLPQASGRKKASVALVRTVLQRRLASSTMAIFESIRRRLEKEQQLLDELETLSPSQRARRLAQLHGRIDDAEQDEDDLDESERDELTDGFTDALELDQIRAEIAALQELLARARRVRDLGTDSKLTALRECLKRAEFNELTDGRGKPDAGRLNQQAELIGIRSGLPFRGSIPRCLKFGRLLLRQDCLVQRAVWQTHPEFVAVPDLACLLKNHRSGKVALNSDLTANRE